MAQAGARDRSGARTYQDMTRSQWPITRAPGLRRTAAALLACVVLLPAPVLAENRPLRTATIAASSAAAADWISTYHALKYFKVRETNPLLRPLDHEPGAMVSAGALLDAGIITTWNMTMGKKHPRVAVAGLWAMTAFRAYLAVHNFRNTQKAARR